MGGLRRYTFFAAFPLLMLCAGCAQGYDERPTMLQQTSFSFDEIPGTGFAHTDLKNTCGPGVDFALPDSLKQKSIRICLEMDLRKEKDAIGQGFAVFVTKDDKTLLWNVLELDQVVSSPGKWIHVADSTEIPPWSNMEQGVVLHIKGYNVSPVSAMDYDNLRIIIKKIDYTLKN